ncbi:hypothetical protein QUB68_24385 [Microcoleus sp. A006_D1]|uniref:hypothetical protein n=1 Tax=Microcoleus sp. A006_D1 TaxID=3055267 RepID=UPI002FD0C8A6
MIIKTIAVSYERKFNLQDFNSVTIGCTLWAQIDPSENEDACLLIVQDKCREAVRSEYRKVKDGSEPAEIFSVNDTEETNAVQTEMIANGDVSMKYKEF